MHFLFPLIAVLSIACVGDDYPICEVHRSARHCSWDVVWYDDPGGFDTALGYPIIFEDSGSWHTEGPDWEPDGEAYLDPRDVQRLIDMNNGRY